MSIHQLPITERQAIAVMRRMEATHEKSSFKLIPVLGYEDLKYVREVRPMRNPRTGAEFDQIIMWGKEPRSRARRSA